MVLESMSERSDQLALNAATAAAVVSLAEKTAKAVVAEAAVTAMKTAEAAQRTADTVLGFGKDLSYIQKDISTINQTLTQLGTIYATKADFSGLAADSLKTHSDHESRLRSLETKIWLAVGAVAILQPVITSLLIKFLIK